ncbi:MAG: glycosyltransferase [Gaiellaceae bacterium]
MSVVAHQPTHTDVEPRGPRCRVGVFSDLLYRRDEHGLSTHQAFIRFVTGLPPRVDEIVLFGRVKPGSERSHYALPNERVRFVELPHYARVTSVGGQLRAYRSARRTFLGELGSLDLVWIFGPHPVAVGLARAAQRQGTRVVLGVRQDYPSYIRHRLPSRRWAWAVPVAHGLERTFRRMARRCPSVALGRELARAYDQGAPVLETGFPLISDRELADPDTARDRDWSGNVNALSVGRIDAEKNPLLLAEIASQLRSRSDQWRLRVVGDGALLESLTERVEASGLSGVVDLKGYVANGPDLWREYDRSSVFLHVSRTEGLPQVLAEAQAAGIPIVATAVGGVPGAIEHERNGLLIPPDDATAAVDALERLRLDAELRKALIAEGLRRAQTETMEAQLDRVAAFLRSALQAA